MRPIWYFVGLLLLIMGGVIFAAGVHQAITPPAEPTVLADLHPSLWWGGLMVAMGALFFVQNKDKVVS